MTVRRRPQRTPRARRRTGRPAALNEGGFGGDPFFGDEWSSHTTENMACLVAGGAGGLVRGQHIVAPSDTRHPANVLVTLMNAVGVETDTLGEVSGAITDLRVS